MNKKMIRLALLAGSVFVSVAHAADGTVNFTGSVTASACTISTTSTTQSVTLGNVSATAFKASGDSTAATAFSIVLASCPATVSNAAVKFDGAANTANSSLLALTTVTGVATGLGVGLYESNSTTLIPLATAAASKPVTTAGATLNFIAKYVATAATVTTGPANAVTNFSISYN